MSEDTARLIGKILAKGQGSRDAIHVAVLPVVAAEDLRPGDEVGFVYGSTELVRRRDSSYDLKPIGIIDPFIDLWHPRKGERCFMFLFPGTITGLRHEWVHPAVDGVRLAANEHEKWLREFADRWSFVYDDLISGAIGKHDGYAISQGHDLHDATELGEDHAEIFNAHLMVLEDRSIIEEVMGRIKKERLNTEYIDRKSVV